MVFSIAIEKHNDLVILKYDSGFVSLSFYPTDPKCLTEDGYYSGESGGECGFNFNKDKNTICFYSDGPSNGTLYVKLKITEEIMKSYYDSIEEWRKYIEETVDEAQEI